MSNGGRPFDVYANRLSPQRKHLWHEVLLTTFLLLYEGSGLVIRDPKEVNRQLRPDAEIFMADKLFYVELDTGSETLDVQVRDRQKLYESPESLLPHQSPSGQPCYASVTHLHDVFLLYVTQAPTRMRNLMQVSSPVSGLALFTTLSDVVAEPFGKVWRTCDNRLVRLPTPSQSSTDPL